MKLFILPHFYKDEISGSSGERKPTLNKTKKSKPRTTRIKMYACDACKYMATDINNLKLHKLESHTQPGKMCNIFVIVRCENMIFNWALPSLSPYITSFFSFFMSFLTFSFVTPAAWSRIARSFGLLSWMQGFSLLLFPFDDKYYSKICSK